MQVFKVIATYYDEIESGIVQAENKEEAEKTFRLTHPYMSYWDVEAFSDEDLNHYNAFLAGKSKPA